MLLLFLLLFIPELFPSLMIRTVDHIFEVSVVLHLSAADPHKHVTNSH